MKKWIVFLAVISNLNLLSAQKIGNYVADKNYGVDEKSIEFDVYADKTYDIIIEVDKKSDIEVKMTKEQANELKSQLLKGIEWIKKADSADIEVDKVIGKVINADASFRYGSYHSGTGYLSLKYIRKKLENSEIYNYIFVTSAGYSSSNKYIKTTGMIMLTYDNAKQLIDLIDENKMNKAKEEIIANKNKQDELLN